MEKSAELSVTAATALSGGTNGTASTSNHQAFLDKISSYPDVNAIGYAGSESAVKGLYAAFADRLRNDVGIRLQVVMHDYSSADSISCVNVKNSAELVYWATGVIAGTAVNKSATNMKYDGELSINTEFTQDELTEALEKANGCYIRWVQRFMFLRISILLPASQTKWAIFSRIIRQSASSTQEQIPLLQFLLPNILERFRMTNREE